eukprot:2552634-Prymnesium_polylepis.1
MATHHLPHPPPAAAHTPPARQRTPYPPTQNLGYHPYPTPHVSQVQPHGNTSVTRYCIARRASCVTAG